MPSPWLPKRKRTEQCLELWGPTERASLFHVDLLTHLSLGPEERVVVEHLEPSAAHCRRAL